MRAVRVCVAGGGLAGAMLAWRLAQRGAAVELLAGHGRGTDATSASGGAVRAFEPLAAQRELAITSMAELLSSQVLREWAGYRRTGFAYLATAGESLRPAVAEIERVLPGSACLTTAREAFGGQALGEPAAGGAAPGRAGCRAVVEREAGYLSPARLRDAVLADLDGMAGTAVTAATLAGAAVEPTGLVRVSAAGRTRDYDAVVLATGAWTPGLLRSVNRPADGYRAKSIAYGIYRVSGWCPPGFCDEATGLYGRPAADDSLLLGVPTNGWDVEPGWQPGGPDPARPERDDAATLAGALFPALRLGPLRWRAGGADCYCDPPVLMLRRAGAAGDQVFTFTGGSGGCVKTVLAASTRAATRLAG